MGHRREELRTGWGSSCVSRLVFSAALAASLGGCGNGYYAVHANSAAARLEEARELGAEELAPYEYYYAREHLRKGQAEAAEADYSDAAELCETSEEYANRAIERARQRSGSKP